MQVTRVVVWHAPDEQVEAEAALIRREEASRFPGRNEQRFGLTVNNY